MFGVEIIKIYMVYCCISVCCKCLIINVILFWDVINFLKLLVEFREEFVKERIMWLIGCK